jgi:hypothetical protein
VVHYNSVLKTENQDIFNELKGWCSCEKPFSNLVGKENSKVKGNANKL